MNVTEIFLDTSIIKIKNVEDYSIIIFGKNYSDFVDFINSNGISDTCKINVAEIVVEEFKKQACDSFAEDETDLKKYINKFRVYYGLSLPDTKDFKKNLDNQLRDYLEAENISIILIPKERSIWNKIIKKSINKKKPFNCGNSESDKGFKDELQWESIIEYAKKSPNELFILITKNSNDFTEDLCDEFYSETNKKLEIYYEIGEAQSRLLEINQIQSNYLFVESYVNSMLDSGELYEIVNRKIKEYYDINIESINKYYDLIDQGNNNYKFFIETLNNGTIGTFIVECQLNSENQITIGEVIICL